MRTNQNSSANLNAAFGGDPDDPFRAITGATTIAQTLCAMLNGHGAPIDRMKERLSPLGVDVPKVVAGLVASGLVKVTGDRLVLTDEGVGVILAFYVFS
jgi:hypothetical protein